MSAVTRVTLGWGAPDEDAAPHPQPVLAQSPPTADETLDQMPDEIRKDDRR